MLVEKVEVRDAEREAPNPRAEDPLCEGLTLLGRVAACCRFPPWLRRQGSLLHEVDRLCREWGM